ncbi:TatD family hydrolase [Candidatus Daviesbacteria bacterium]|nr:TatD family hydrolase [Candidatus Daviesbacteria bacterium]
MNLTDTHAHLYWDSFTEDFDAMIKRALDAQVTYIINVGVDVKTSQKALDQVKTYPWPKGLQVFSTIGIHPHEKDVSIHEDIEELARIYQTRPDQIVAVGECGLDYKEADEKTKKLQKQLFQTQIDLAKKLNLPLIVHCRGAWDEVLQMTKDHFGIYHCYSGFPPITQKVLSSKFLVSFAGNLTYPKNEYLQEAAKIIPLDRIVLETDCPFLPPQSKRGKRNEPSFMMETAQAVADIKGLSLEEVAKQTSLNVASLLSTLKLITL